MAACKLQPRVFQDFHVFNKKKVTKLPVKRRHFIRNAFRNFSSLAILFLDNVCVLHAIHLYNIYTLYIHKYY